MRIYDLGYFCFPANKEYFEQVKVKDKKFLEYPNGLHECMDILREFDL